VKKVVKNAYFFARFVKTLGHFEKKSVKNEGKMSGFYILLGEWGLLSSRACISPSGQA